mmetsp:Transcript_9229/g.15477  ORF Transcript_9229/g.15477 Transcript_9229/m.15477 type:complete len:225 (+) Transcript_9229:1-675(+)
MPSRKNLTTGGKTSEPWLNWSNAAGFCRGKMTTLHPMMRPARRFSMNRTPSSRQPSAQGHSGCTRPRFQMQWEGELVAPTPCLQSQGTDQQTYDTTNTAFELEQLSYNRWTRMSPEAFVGKFLKYTKILKENNCGYLEGLKKSMFLNKVQDVGEPMCNAIRKLSLLMSSKNSGMKPSDFTNSRAMEPTKKTLVDTRLPIGQTTPPHRKANEEEQTGWTQTSGPR